MFILMVICIKLEKTAIRCMSSVKGLYYEVRVLNKLFGSVCFAQLSSFWFFGFETIF